MKILFLTVSPLLDPSSRGPYSDLIRMFSLENHEVYLVTPLERRYNEKTKHSSSNNLRVLKIRTLNFVKSSNIIEKVISTLILEYQYIWGVKKYFPGVSFDLILYSTPPITFTRIVKHIRKKDGAKSYLLLKDIFPQNAVDLNMIRKNGLVYKYFRRKEKKLYAISDHIGCMSPANKKYILDMNPEIDNKKVEVNPNSIKPTDPSMSVKERLSVRNKYGIPADSTVFIYGGNLGKPQGIDFLMEIIMTQTQYEDVFFVIIGSGTEYPKVKKLFEKNHPDHALLLESLPKDEYDKLLQSCDVGMIFLDRRFTIPNFPSRLLPYLEHRMPVIAATDSSTDIGQIIVENCFGLWSDAGDLQSFKNNVFTLSQSSELREKMGKRAYKFLINNYTVSRSYNIILSHFNAIKQQSKGKPKL